MELTCVVDALAAAREKNLVPCLQRRPGCILWTMTRPCFCTSAKAASLLPSSCILLCLVSTGFSGLAQTASPSKAPADPRARQIIVGAVTAELAANDADHTAWTYRDHDTDATKDVVYEVIETPAGSLRREVESGGKPVDESTRQAESTRIAALVHDQAEAAKQRKAGKHDDDQAREMLKMLPDAYLWTIKSESADAVALNYAPNPDFHPPDMEARVMSMMAGEVIVVKGDDRIRTLRGTLTDDVKLGFGLLGKLQKGGTFDVERREVGPHHWQITESRVHIGGHALLFKTIGQQEDEIKTDFRPSNVPTLEAAAQQLGVPATGR